MISQPILEMRQRLRTEPGLVGGSELSHEWHDSSIGHRADRSAKLTCAAKAAIQFAQELHTQSAMLERFDAITLRVLVAVEVMFEWAIVLVDQFGVIALQPAFGVLFCKGPAHDVEAFVDDLTVRQDKHGNRSLG